jgi:hypothetical protein
LLAGYDADVRIVLRLAAPFALLLCTAFAACAGSHSAERGRPAVDAGRTAFWIWNVGPQWRVRVTGGGRPHRFQGSVEPEKPGEIGSLRTASDELRSGVALVGESVQFDFEADAETGFDLDTKGGCLHFDLYLDGKRRADRIHLGEDGASPPHVPFPRCP